MENGIVPFLGVIPFYSLSVVLLALELVSGLARYFSSCKLVDPPWENIAGLFAGFDDHAGAVLALLLSELEVRHNCSPVSLSPCSLSLISCL